MNIKKFRGTSLADVLAAINTELGDDAVILRTDAINKDQPDYVASSRVMVTVAIPEKKDLTQAQIDELADHPAVATPAPEPRTIAAIPRIETASEAAEKAIREVFSNLLERGVDADFLIKLREICRRSLNVSAMRSKKSVEKFVQYLVLKTLLPYEKIAESRILALIGPSGAGKSTSIAKLVATLAGKGLRNIVVIAPKRQGDANLEKLMRRFGAQLLHAKDAQDVQKALAKHAEHSYVLIDTPSITDDHAELVSYLPDDPRIEKNLVLRADFTEQEIHRVLCAFHYQRYRRILFTKLDQTSRYGHLLNALLLADAPISYLAQGSALHGSITPYSKEKMVELLALT